MYWVATAQQGMTHIVLVIKGKNKKMSAAGIHDKKTS